MLLKVVVVLEDIMVLLDLGISPILPSTTLFWI